MASPNSTFTEIVTTTLRDHKTEISDNVTNHNALLRRLKNTGRIEKSDGGYEIVEPLSYAENATFQRYSGYDTLNVSPSDVLSAAKYDWKQAAVHVSASGLETAIQNTGKNQLIKLMKSRMDNAIGSLMNNISTDVYSDGTATNQINGLQALVADAGTGTVGGINSSTYTFWKNKVNSAAAPIDSGGAITPGPTTFQELMHDLYIRLERGMDAPDLIVADYNYFTFYEQSLTANQRYTNATNTADASFATLKFKGADVFHDGGSGIASNHMYMLNTKYLKLVVHKNRDMEPMGEKMSVNQDAEIVPILWAGNLTCSNRSLQGVVKA